MTNGIPAVLAAGRNLELAYDDYVWDLYEETGVELETGTNYMGKVNIFYTNYPG